MVMGGEQHESWLVTKLVSLLKPRHQEVQLDGDPLRSDLRG
jgi:hypothetical protein